MTEHEGAAERHGGAVMSGREARSHVATQVRAEHRGIAAAQRRIALYVRLADEPWKVAAEDLDLVEGWAGEVQDEQRRSGILARVEQVGRISWASPGSRDREEGVR